MYDAAGSSVVDWNYTNRAVSGSSDYYKKETSGNPNLSIGELSGNEGKPVYLMIDGTKNENKINITINSTNARPLVIIYTGTTKNNNKNNYKPLTLNIFGSGGTAITFTGALYAPDADVVVNIGSGCVFEGSIYSRDFDVVSSGAQFRYRDIFSGSSSGSGTTSTKSRLVEDSSLVWNS